MNVYDFDKTIYLGDCEVDFHKFMIRQNPSLLLNSVHGLKAWVDYKFGKINRTQFKEETYQYLRHVTDLSSIIEEFWIEHDQYLKDWYLDQKRDDDLIISASPDFLIGPICRQLNVSYLSSRLNTQTIKHEGETCYGQEKVRRYREMYGDQVIDAFYSDSQSDLPLAGIAKEAYIVNKDERLKWHY